MANLEVTFGDIALFWDRRSALVPDPERNQIAVIVGDYALALRRARVTRIRQVETIPLQELANCRKLAVHRPSLPVDGERIAEYFISHRDRPEHFAAGLKAYRSSNFQPLVDNALFPARPTYADDAEYEVAWQTMKTKLAPGDSLFTTCLASPLSRFIAWSTNGPWSHVAWYIGNGEIWESVTSGVRTGLLELYHGRNNWVAAYRHIGFVSDPMTYEMAKEAATAKKWRPGYNYRGAIYCGARAFLGDHDHALVPNSMIYQGLYTLIAHA